jgi:hypothetical protein
MTVYMRVPEGHPLVGSTLLLLFLEAVNAGKASGCHAQQAGIDSLQQTFPLLPLLASTSQPQQHCSSRLQVFCILRSQYKVAYKYLVYRIKTKSPFL